MSAEILSYSRSKGLFAGISLKGSVVSPDESDMEGTYGESATALQVLEASTGGGAELSQQAEPVFYTHVHEVTIHDSAAARLSELTVLSALYYPL